MESDKWYHSRILIKQKSEELLRKTVFCSGGVQAVGGNQHVPLQVAEDEKVSLLTKQQDLELEYENKLLSLREQLLEQQKHAIDEDIDVINLQRLAVGYLSASDIIILFTGQPVYKW